MVLVAACGGRETHFMKDKAYREAVQADFTARLEQTDAVFSPFDKTGTALNDGELLSQEEHEALEFLYAYMPLADAVDYPASYYLDQVRATFRIRKEMGWKVPEREFRHFVLPIRVNNENLDTARVAFNREIAPRVKGLSMKDAILEVNHWCHEKMTYQPSDARTSSPLASLKNALGRCGEESIHPEMGPYRRQPRLGGGLGRRTVALHRRLRARAGAGPRLVQRPRLPRDAHAHQGLRPL